MDESKTEITMIRTARGSNDGNHVLVFENGETYTIGRDITARLASVFVDTMECAKYVDPPPLPATKTTPRTRTTAFKLKATDGEL